jgi:hypothetical protein
MFPVRRSFCVSKETFWGNPVATIDNRKKKRRLAEANRHLPVNSKSLINCPLLAFMTTNNDSLSVEFCVSVSGGRIPREGLFGFYQYAKLAFSIQPPSLV